MEHFDKAYDILERKFEQAVGKGEAGVMDIIELSRGMKNILTVEAMCEEDGQSGDSRYDYMPGRRSYAQRRNRMGQYSRNGSYDGEKDQLMHKIDELKKAVDHMG